MPHLYVEYSDNITALNEAALLQALNEAVASHPSIPAEEDLKARIAPVRQYRVGTQPAGRAFVHTELRLLSGRTPEMKKELSELIGGVLKATIPQPEGLVVQLSADIVDMDRAAYFKGRL